MKFAKSSLIAIVLALTVFGLASANYIGPNRTITRQEWQGQVQGQTCTYASGWRYIVEKVYACDTPGEPWLTEYPDYYHPCGPSTNGNKVYATTCRQVSVTVNLPPATVSGSAICDQPGNNGWCTGGAALDLSASEPLNGYVITGIESTLGMLCSTNAASISCAWPSPEGESSLNYWALSSYGDTSTMGSASFRVDTLSPEMTLSAPDPDGFYSWFVSLPVVVSATASDATSGLALLQGQVDEQDPSTAPGQTVSVSVLTDGIHDLTFRAEDYAGNTITWEKRIIVDTQPPALSISIPEPDGWNGWHVTPVAVHVDASDLLSGVQETAVSVDGGASWQWSSTLLDGLHTVLARATDVAGNTSTASVTVKVDTLPPQSAFTDPPEGSTAVVSGQATFSGASQDATSGLAGAEISLDNGQSWQALAPDAGGLWSYAWDTTGVPNGTYPVLVSAGDLAGNEEHTARVTVIVANAPPDVDLPASWLVRETAPVSIRPHSIPVSGARLTLSDPLGRWPARIYEFGAGDLPLEFTWDGRFGDGTVAPPGEYPVLLEAWDTFGNTGRDQGKVFIPVPPTPTPSPTATPMPFPTSTAQPSPISSPEETPTLAPSPTATPTQTIPATPLPPPATPQPVAPPVPEKPAAPAPKTLLLWPVFGFVALLAALASASLSDSRPRALRRLGKALESILGKQP